MDAAADYAAAVRALAHRLPAYVSYEVHSHVLAGPVKKDETVTVVVRSSDGKIVKGKPPSIKIGSDSKYENDVVAHPPFDSACYAAVSARDATYEGASVEALALKNVCKKPDADEGDFTTLYVDRGSREPLAATGGNHEDVVAVAVAQHFARVGRYLLPSAFDVRVKGTGVMFWLDITGHQSYDNFTFGDTMPS